MTLEKEFEEYKALHKYSILKAKMMRYFETIEQSEIDIPEFQKDEHDKNRIEFLANRELNALVLRDDNLQKFNSLYEKAWAELAPLLE